MIWYDMICVSKDMCIQSNSRYEYVHHCASNLDNLSVSLSTYSFFYFLRSSYGNKTWAQKTQHFLHGITFARLGGRSFHATWCICSMLDMTFAAFWNFKFPFQSILHSICRIVGRRPSYLAWDIVEFRHVQASISGDIWSSVKPWLVHRFSKISLKNLSFLGLTETKTMRTRSNKIETAGWGRGGGRSAFF